MSLDCLATPFFLPLHHILFSVYIAVYLFIRPLKDILSVYNFWQLWITLPQTSVWRFLCGSEFSFYLVNPKRVTDGLYTNSIFSFVKKLLKCLSRVWSTLNSHQKWILTHCSSFSDTQSNVLNFGLSNRYVL